MKKMLVTLLAIVITLVATNGGHDISRQEYHYFVREVTRCHCCKEVVYDNFTTAQLNDGQINHVFAPAEFDFEFTLTDGTWVKFYNTVFHSSVSLIKK